MSRHIVYREHGITIAYGIDCPTGGYFYQYFAPCPNDSSEEETVIEEEGLTLTKLYNALFEKYHFVVPARDMIGDFLTAEFPTNLQRNVGIMFRKDIAKMLADVSTDIVENWARYLKKE